MSVLVRSQQASAPRTGSITSSASPRSMCSASGRRTTPCWPCSTSGSTVIDGDFSRGEPELPDGIDVAIHSAATVSFDPPIDEGFQTNLLGAQNLYRGVARRRQPPASGARLDRVRGRRPEGRDPRGPARPPGGLAPRGRARARRLAATSRPRAASPRCSSTSWRRPRRSTPAPVPRRSAERRRGAPQGTGWTSASSSTGGMRARSLGWPDVYTFTKAMGERAVEELAHARAPSALDRPALDHRVGARASRPRVDRRVQDGRPDHPGVRAGADPGVPGHPRGHRRPDPGRLRRERDPRGRGEPPGRRRARPLQRLERIDGTRCVSSSSTSGSASTSRRIRCPSAGAGEHKVPELEFPRQPEGRVDAPPGRAAHRRGREGRHAPAEVQGDARRRRARRPRQARASIS